MKKGLSVAIVAILTLFAFGGIHAEEPWVSVGTTTELQLSLCEHLTVGEYEVAATAYSPTQMSEYSIADTGLVITSISLPKNLSEKATENNFKTYKIGDSCSLRWEGSTYLLNGVPTPAISYEVWVRKTNKIGACGVPKNLLIQ